MPVSFINYRRFESKVSALVPPEAFHCYRYILPSVDHLLRLRFIQTLTAGCDMVAAFNILNIGGKLPDSNYKRLVSYLKNTTAVYTA